MGHSLEQIQMDESLNLRTEAMKPLAGEEGKVCMVPESDKSLHQMSNEFNYHLFNKNMYSLLDLGPAATIVKRRLFHAHFSLNLQLLNWR